MAASRRVTRAVGDVLDLAPRRGEVSLHRLVEAVSTDRGRPIEIKMADLPEGVCGQWRQYTDRDEFLIQQGLPTWNAPWPTNSGTWCSAMRASRWPTWPGCPPRSPATT